MARFEREEMNFNLLIEEDPEGGLSRVPEGIELVR